MIKEKKRAKINESGLKRMVHENMVCGLAARERASLDLYSWDIPF